METATRHAFSLSPPAASLVEKGTANTTAKAFYHQAFNTSSYVLLKATDSFLRIQAGITAFPTHGSKFIDNSELQISWRQKALLKRNKPKTGLVQSRNGSVQHCCNRKSLLISAFLNTHVPATTCHTLSCLLTFCVCKRYLVSFENRDFHFSA